MSSVTNKKECGQFSSHDTDITILADSAHTDPAAEILGKTT